MFAEALTALGSQLAEISGLRVYDHVPEQINPPAVVFAMGAGTYDDDFSGAVVWNVTALILVSEAQGASRAQAAFQAYLDPTGDTSVVAAIHADPTLDGTINSARVEGWSDPQTFDIGGIAYSGCELTIELIGE